MLNDMEPLVKKRLLLAIVSFVLLIVLSSLWYLISTGPLTVSVKNGSATIEIFRQETLYKSVQKTSSFNERLGAGEYIVVARDPMTNVSVKAQVTVSPFLGGSVELSLPKGSTNEAVTNLPILYPYFGDTTIAFYDLVSRRLALVDANNTYRFISDRFAGLRSIEWSPDGTGYFVANKLQDDQSKLYRYDGRDITEILSESRPGSMSIATDNTGKLYIANGEELSSVSKDGRIERHAAKLPENPYLIDVFDDRLVISESGPSMVDNQPNFSYTLLVINTDGKVLGKQSKKAAESINSDSSAVWSPDGNKLLFSDGYSATLYDKTLSNPVSLPTGAARSPVWESDSAILFAGGNHIWRFDLNSKESRSIASVLPVDQVFALQPDSSGEFLYFLAGDLRNSSWYRLSKKENYSPNNSANILGGSNMQVLSTYCKAYYINHKRLSMLAVPVLADQPASEAGRISSECPLSVNDYLNTLGIAKDVNLQTLSIID